MADSGAQRVNIRPGVTILSVLQHLNYRPWYALSEFGMGMKSAACWFARNWAVRSSALGEPVERLVAFDIERIVRDSVEELTVTTTPVAVDRHFTEIVLSNLNRLPQGRTLGKMR